MSTSISLKDLLGISDQHEKSAIKHPIDPLAQAMELRARWASVYGHPTAGLSGALVKEKRGLLRFNHDPVLIVWRMLDAEHSRQDWQIIKHYIKQYTVPEPCDCLVAFLDDNGKTLLCAPHSLILLDPIPDPSAGDTAP